MRCCQVDRWFRLDKLRGRFPAGVLVLILHFVDFGGEGGIRAVWSLVLLLQCVVLVGFLLLRELYWSWLKVFGLDTS
jgi:hypothetical protein